jgi:hypothetical protein
MTPPTVRVSCHCRKHIVAEGGRRFQLLRRSTNRIRESRLRLKSRSGLCKLTEAGFGWSVPVETAGEEGGLEVMQAPFPTLDNHVYFPVSPVQ